MMMMTYDEWKGEWEWQTSWRQGKLWALEGTSLPSWQGLLGILLDWAYRPCAEWVFNWLQMLVTSVHLAVQLGILPARVFDRLQIVAYTHQSLGWTLLLGCRSLPNWHIAHTSSHEYWAFTGSAVARLGILPPCIYWAELMARVSLVAWLGPEVSE